MRRVCWGAPDRWKKEQHDGQAHASRQTRASARPCRTTMIEKTGQPYATEAEDYGHGVATPPEEQAGREANPRTDKSAA